MIHRTLTGNHCFHCGESFDTDGICTNDQCQKRETELPEFPWSRCECGENAFHILSWWEIFKISWLLIFGIICVIVSIFSLKPLYSILGIIVIFIWFAQKTLMVVETSIDKKVAIQEKVRRATQVKFDRGNKTAKDKKKLKDEKDKIKSLQAKLWGARLHKKIIWLLLIFFILLSYIFSFYSIPTVNINIAENSNKAIKSFKESSFLKLIKKETDWNRSKMLNLEHILRDEHGLSFEQFKELRTAMNINPNINYKSIMELLDKTEKNGTELYNLIKRRIPEPSIAINKKKKEIKIKKKKSYLQKLNSVLWIIAIVIEIPLAFIIAIFTIIGIIAFAFSFLYFLLDELEDIVETNFNSWLEKHDQQKTEKNKGNKETSNSASGIVNSIVGSTLSTIPSVLFENYKKRR